MILDDLSRAECKRNKNAVVGFILMASYLYYHRLDNSPVLSDTVFDSMCKFALKHYDDIAHKYKHLVTTEDLKAGSLYKLGYNDYPIQIQQQAIMFSEWDKLPDNWGE